MAKGLYIGPMPKVPGDEMETRMVEHATRILHRDSGRATLMAIVHGRTQLDTDIAVGVPSMTNSDEKDLLSYALKDVFSKYKVSEYWMMMESWMLEIQGGPDASADELLEKVRSEGVDKQPNRTEVVSILHVTREATEQRIFNIERNADGTFKQLVFKEVHTVPDGTAADDPKKVVSIESRFANLLPALA